MKNPSKAIDPLGRSQTRPSPAGVLAPAKLPQGKQNTDRRFYTARALSHLRPEPRLSSRPRAKELGASKSPSAYRLGFSYFPCEGLFFCLQS